MIPTAPETESNEALQARLYRHLAVMALVFGVLGLVIGGGGMAIAAISGVAMAMIYFALLAAQTRRLFASGRMPLPILLITGVAFRQLICLIAPVACYLVLPGSAWLVATASLIVARHWIFVAAWPRNQALIPIPTV